MIWLLHASWLRNQILTWIQLFITVNKQPKRPSKLFWFFMTNVLIKRTI